MYYSRLKNTIVALATAPGSAIGIIRISGNSSFKIASDMTGGKKFTHMKASLAKLRGEKNTVVDKCIILPFKSPESYTGEDVIEFHVHGASMNAAEIISSIIKLGAIPALKGEFTFRAFFNFKLSLSEAFSLNTLITSENPFAVELARKESFENKSLTILKKYISDWEYYLTISTALIDFPDQISSSLPLSKIRISIDELSNFLHKIIENTDSFQKVTNFSILIAGKPNVGKSSLFNALLNKQRAIISEIPGTTRDYLSETLYIEGFPVIIIDSAGIRDSDTEIEKQGIFKSKQLINNSDLIFVVTDPSQPLDDFDKELLLKTENKPRLLIENKSDLVSKFNFSNSIKVSTVSGEGLEKIRFSIGSYIESLKPDAGQHFFFNDWQTQTALKILSLLEDLTNVIETDQIEIIYSCIKEIFFNIRNLSGEISTFDVYDKIFGSFCLGK